MPLNVGENRIPPSAHDDGGFCRFCQAVSQAFLNIYWIMGALVAGFIAKGPIG
jgi:hypothetical protein